MATRIKRLYQRSRRKPQVTRNRPESWMEAGATLILAILGTLAWAVFLALVFARSIP